jgi:hypothetical protein
VFGLHSASKLFDFVSYLENNDIHKRSGTVDDVWYEEKRRASHNFVLPSYKRTVRIGFYDLLFSSSFVGDLTHFTGLFVSVIEQSDARLYREIPIIQRKKRYSNQTTCNRLVDCGDDFCCSFVVFLMSSVFVLLCRISRSIGRCLLKREILVSSAKR